MANFVLLWFILLLGVAVENVPGPRFGIHGRVQLRFFIIIFLIVHSILGLFLLKIISIAIYVYRFAVWQLALHDDGHWHSALYISGVSPPSA